MIEVRGIRIVATALVTVMEHRGHVNRRAITVDGDDYPEGDLVFIGFDGVRHEDGTCDGRYRFRLAQPRDQDKDSFDFATLPGWPTGAIVLP